MNARLMHRDREFDPPAEGPWQAPALTQDLELDTLVQAMAGQDPFLADVARRALLAGLENDVDTIRYRQAALADSLRNAQATRHLYALAVEAIERKRKAYFGALSSYPSAILHGASDVLRIFVDMLRRLRDAGRVQAGRFRSEAFTNLFAMLERELDDAYLARILAHLKDLRFDDGVFLSGELGRGNQGTNYMVRQPTGPRPPWWVRMFSSDGACSFRLHERDEAGARALGELQGRGINPVANALAQSAEHLLAFFEMLRRELAFHVACLNLHERLSALGVPVCFPVPAPVGDGRHHGRGLCDPCLALQMGRPVVPNAFDADGRPLVVITGANRGGKSSFLRAVGLAQVMMHAGLFVGAEAFEGTLCNGLYTHYRREEDTTMTSGKLDEELRRMSELADRLRPGALLLLNESFAATNEREGSEIAWQVVSALRERRVRIFFVTHLHAFARGVHARRLEGTLFLRAERRPDGTRTFRLIEGEPLATSHGEDLYRKIFRPEPAPVDPAGA